MIWVYTRKDPDEGQTAEATPVDGGLAGEIWDLAPQLMAEREWG